ncbi:MAG: glycosyltransferase [Anaerotignaceae bacterium]
MKRVLIAMAVHDTEENKRTELTKQVLDSIFLQGIYIHHDFWVIDNNSCQATKDLLISYEEEGLINVITNEQNIGTAEAVNLAWKYRVPGQHCIKMDNDVTINSFSWVTEMVEAIERDERIGIVGLKRKDCWEEPNHALPDWRSELVMLPHMAGQRWIIVEKCHHIIGTCQMYSSALLDKMGYLYQPCLYGYDDVLASHRSTVAGHWNVFLPHIEIDHIDPGQTEYQSWKEKHSSEVTQQVIKITHEYYHGIRPIYYNPFVI